MTSPQQSMLDQRYGRRPGARRSVVLAVAAVGALGLAWLLWAAVSYTSDPVSAELRGYEVLDGSRTEVTVVVDRRDGAGVRCEVYAQAADHSTVGERVLELAAGDAGTFTVIGEIETQRRAVNGVLRACTSTG